MANTSFFILYKKHWSIYNTLQCINFRKMDKTNENIRIKQQEKKPVL